MYSKDLNIIVYNVEQNVAACHTGYYSCFYRQMLKNNEFNILYKNKIFDPDLVYDKVK